MPSVRLEAGILSLGAVRNAVMDLNKMGFEASLTVGSGFLSKPVWININDAGLPTLQKWLMQFERTS